MELLQSNVVGVALNTQGDASLTLVCVVESFRNIVTYSRSIK